MKIEINEVLKEIDMRLVCLKNIIEIQKVKKYKNKTFTFYLFSARYDELQNFRKYLKTLTKEGS